MFKNILIFIYIFSFFSCFSEQLIKITTKINGKDEENIIPANTYEIMVGNSRNDYSYIKGLDKLPDLKKIIFIVVPGLEDYSFLSNIPKLEILSLCSYRINDFSFLKSNPNLRALEISGAGIRNNKIDLISNTKLKYLALLNVSFVKNEKDFSQDPFDLKLLNIPASLEYLNLSLNPFIKIDEDFLKQVEKIRFVFLSEDIYGTNKVYFDKHKNFIFKWPEDLLPEEFSEKKLFKEPRIWIY